MLTIRMTVPRCDALRVAASFCCAAVTIPPWHLGKRWHNVLQTVLQNSGADPRRLEPVSFSV
jgi:hypothetical protein